MSVKNLVFKLLMQADSKSFVDDLKRSQGAVGNVEQSLDSLKKGADTVRTTFTALAGAMAALGVGVGLRELAQTADSYTNLSTRIQIATREHGNFTEAIAGVHQVALSTNSTLDATATLFTRLNTVGKDMGLSQQQALDLTKTITQAIQVSGGSAQQSEAAITQFIQAMQGGVLRGEEFNSIMENGFGLAEALAKGLGVTTGELRGMAEAGELSAERVVKAISSQSSQIQELYNQFPTTIGNALQKISTQWEILIGKMDQANGASTTVAGWLSTLADSLDIVEVLITDLGEGFIWVGDQLRKIDPQTIEALKAALLTAYESLKSLAGTVGNAFEITVDTLNSVLSNVLNLNTGIGETQEKTQGFTKILEILNVALGYVSDGFNGITIATNLFVGLLYDLSAAWYQLKSTFTWGEAKTQAIADMDAMGRKAQEYYDKASKGAMDFKSKGLEAYEELGKTQEQKNQERLDNNEATIAKLLEQERTHSDSYKLISDERVKLEQALSDARKSGDQAAVDQALTNISALEKREQEWLRQSQDITKAKVDAAQAIVDATLEANGKIGESELKLLNVKLAAQGMKAEFGDAGKVIVSAMEPTSESVETVATSASNARKAAQALGIDLDKSLNRISDGFREGGKNLNTFTNGLDELGVTGEGAGRVTYEAWLKWLKTAKSQTEIDMATAKLEEFGEQGQISTNLVEQGLIAVKNQAQQLPDAIDPVTEAFKRLGIQTKEQLKLSAQMALADFETVRQSGQATQADLQRAYEKTIQLAHASGDAQVIATAEAKAASLGLEVQISKSGRVSVESIDSVTDSYHRGRDAANRFGDAGVKAFRDMGRAAEEELHSIEKWNKAMQAKSDEYYAQRSAPMSGKASYTTAEIEQQLKDMGYSAQQAKQIAAEIFNSSQGQRKASASYVAARGIDVASYMSTDQGNSLYVKEQLEKYAAYKPNYSGTQAAGTVETSSKHIKIDLNAGNEKATVYADEAGASALESLLNELKVLKKAT